MYSDCKKALIYFKADKWYICIYLAIIGLQIGLGLLLSWPMAILFDSVLSYGPPRTDFMHRLFLSVVPSDPIGRIFGISALGLTMKVVNDVMNSARQMLFYRINNYGQMRARQQLYEKIARIKNLQDGDGIYRILYDTGSPQIILHTLIGGCLSGINLIVMLSIMIVSCNGVLTVTAIAVAPFLALQNWYFKPRIKRQTLIAKEVDAEMTKWCEFKEIASSLDFFKQAANNWLRLNWEQEKYNFLVHSVFSIAGTIIFTYGGYLIYRDQFVHPIANGMTIGTFCVFLDYMGKLWEPLGRLMALPAEIQPGIAGMERINEVLNTG